MCLCKRLESDGAVADGFEINFEIEEAQTGSSYHSGIGLSQKIKSNEVSNVLNILLTTFISEF